MLEEIEIEKMIYEIRGKQVMLTSDVAKLYEVDTKALNQTIKRNIKRFPESFCFKLTVDEWSNLRSQIVTSNNHENKILQHGGIRYLPFILTEQGIMMLSGLLKSDIAVDVNVKIIDAFVKMRKYLSNLIEQKYINDLILKESESN